MKQGESISERYYTIINSDDKPWGINVTTVGFQNIKPNSAYPPVGHPASHAYNYSSGRILDEYQLVYIVKGKGVFASNHVGETEIGEGSVFLLFKDEWHTYKPLLETGWDAFWVGFNGENINSLLENKLFTEENPLFKIGFNEEVIAFYQQMLGLVKRDEPGSQYLLAGIVSHLLGYLLYFRKTESFAYSSSAKLVNRAKVKMRENIGSLIRPEDIAFQLNVSYSWFRRVFKQYTGVSPAQYIILQKIQFAKEMLIQTNLPIKQIALNLGFETVGYFSTYFKRVCGKKPLEYRAMCRVMNSQESGNRKL